MFALLVGVLGVAGIRLGMLMAPRVGRIADRIDADPADPDDLVEPVEPVAERATSEDEAP